MTTIVLTFWICLSGVDGASADLCRPVEIVGPGSLEGCRANARSLLARVLSQNRGYALRGRLLDCREGLES